MASIWLALYAIHAALPNIRPGADVVYEAKFRFIQTQQVFPPNAPIRVAMFGNSKTLAGFDPISFDTLAGGRVHSYNAGLPNWEEFVDNLEVLCARGQAPKHVLLQIAWSDRLGPLT